MCLFPFYVPSIKTSSIFSPAKDWLRFQFHFLNPAFEVFVVVAVVVFVFIAIVSDFTVVVFVVVVVVVVIVVVVVVVVVVFKDVLHICRRRRFL